MTKLTLEQHEFNALKEIIDERLTPVSYTHLTLPTKA